MKFYHRLRIKLTLSHPAVTRRFVDLRFKALSSTILPPPSFDPAGAVFSSSFFFVQPVNQNYNIGKAEG